MVQRNLFRAIQNQLTEEYTKAYFDNWNKLLENIEINKNDPKKFWKRIRQLLGGRENMSLYLKDNRGNKIYKNEEKEKLFRQHWEQIFQITQEENNMFCPDKDREIAEFFSINENRTKPYN